MHTDITSHDSPIGMAVAIIAACLALSIAAPTVVLAEDAQAQAEALFLEGREHLRAGDNIQAAELFFEAYELIEVPELLYNIAHAYRRGGELALAEEYYQRYLNEATDPPNEEEVVETIIEIQQQLAAQRATLSIRSAPSGAAIFVDGEDEPRCQAPCDIDLDAGQYRIRATLDGHADTGERIELQEQEEASIQFTMEPLRSFGHLFVKTDVDSAMLFAGGEQYPLPRGASVELQAGPQPVAIEWRGNRVEHTVDVEAEKETHLFIPVAAAGSGATSPLQATAVGLGGASVALAAAATLTGLQARSTYDSLHTQREQLGAVDDDLVRAGQRQKSAANMFWLGSALTLSAGASLWAWDWFRNRSSTPERIEASEQ